MDSTPDSGGSRRDDVLGAIFILSVFVGLAALTGSGDFWLAAVLSFGVSAIALLLSRTKLILLLAAVVFVSLRLWFALAVTRQWTMLPLCIVATTIAIGLWWYSARTG